MLLVCSLDDEISLTRLTRWYQDSQCYINKHEAIYAVCGLKDDLPDHQKEVTLTMMERFADHVGFSSESVFQVSAKTGAGIDDMLKAVCAQAMEKFRHNSPSE